MQKGSWGKEKGEGEGGRREGGRRRGKEKGEGEGERRRGKEKGEVEGGRRGEEGEGGKEKGEGEGGRRRGKEKEGEGGRNVMSIISVSPFQTLCMLFFYVLADCMRSVDAVFLLDTSDGVVDTVNPSFRQYINNAASFFNIRSDKSRVGFVTYSNTPTIHSDLDDHPNIPDFQNMVNGAVFTRGIRDIPSALDSANALLNPANNRGARPDSDGIPRIVILIAGNEIYNSTCNQCSKKIN